MGAREAGMRSFAERREITTFSLKPDGNKRTTLGYSQFVDTTEKPQTS